MQTISWVDIATVSISFAALIISLFSLYWNRLKKFKGNVVQSMRTTLVWHTVAYEDGDGEIHTVINEPCISLDCEFINDGAKAGKIEDVLLYLQPDTGNRIACYTYLVSDESIDYYFDSGQMPETLRNFSPVWIPPRRSKHKTILFTASEGNQKIIDQICEGIIKLKLAYSGDNTSTRHRINRQAPYAFSKITSEYHVTSKQVEDWRNGKVVVLDPQELINNRRKLHDIDL